MILDYPVIFPMQWPTKPDDTLVDGEADTYPPDPPKCPDCKGEGKIVLLTGVVDCETCDGSGY